MNEAQIEQLAMQIIANHGLDHWMKATDKVPEEVAAKTLTVMAFTLARYCAKYWEEAQRQTSNI